MVEQKRIGLDSIIAHFQELKDPRCQVNLKHPLISVVVICLMAVLAGAGGPTAIARWARLKEEELLGALDLPHGIPAKDVYRRVLSLLKPQAFQNCFVNWLQSLRTAAAAATGVTQPVLAVDGKTLRRSHDRAKGLGALHSVSIWASEFGLSLGQVATDQKSNEITAIPELLKLVDITGAIITIDAMGTQKAIAAQIIDLTADYVLGLKGNQESLHAAVAQHIEQQLEQNLPIRQHETIDRGHGRQETRNYYQMPAPKTLPGFENWKGLKTIGVVFHFCVCQGKETLEARYYISSLPLGVKLFAHAIRSHWAVENSCHWSLDVTYREDDSRIRNENARESFAWLNRMTLSLLQQHPGKESIAMKRRSCGWDFNYLTQVLMGTTK